MEFNDLKSQYLDYQAKIDSGMRAVLEHGRFILGPEVAELEERLAMFCGVQHVITCANGTDALQIALMALGAGPGDEVIVPAFSYVATAEAVALLGARPVFADIDPRSFTIDPGSIESAITGKTKAIIPVSLFGQCADFDSIQSIAGERGIPLIEDAAQSFGARYKNRMSCNLSEIACTSFFPSKPLGCYGDGGALFTNDDQLAKAIRLIARHGQDRRYHHVRIGINSRLDTLQAAVLLPKLEGLPGEIQERRRIAQRYHDGLAAEPAITLPEIEPGNESVWAQYTIGVERRDHVRQHLQHCGIPTAVHYPHPLNAQPAFKDPDVQVPFAESAARRVLSLPMSAYLTAEDQDRTVANLLEAVSKNLLNSA